ncbi:MAG: hypothetical protein MK193_01860 [Lentisphaeria bacterium]|nr:hypothetical protein [Lentisphaeria bacterium]
MNSPYLIFTSSGQYSNHKEWLPGKQFDLWIYDYQDTESDYHLDADFYDRRAGGKFSNLLHAYKAHPKRFESYEYIMVADDDIEISGDQLNKCFQITKEYNLWVSQPAFMIDGKISHHQTRVKILPLLRYSNFVEMTCPIFQTQKLLSFLEVYDDTLMGHGIDWWFIEHIKAPPKKIAIIDQTPCRNPLDLKKGNQREIDKLQDMPTRVQTWQKLKDKHNLSFDEVKVDATGTVYTMESILKGIFSFNLIFLKYKEKLQKMLKV